MSKYSLTHRLTMVKDTFNEFEFLLGNRHDVYIHQILVIMDYTTHANIVADDKQGYQLSKTNESGLAPLSNNVIWKEIQTTGDADAADIPMKNTYFKEFDTPIKFTAIESFWFGALMADAGFCEVKLLVSDRDVVS